MESVIAGIWEHEEDLNENVFINFDKHVLAFFFIKTKKGKDDENRWKVQYVVFSLILIVLIIYYYYYFPPL